MRILYIIRGLPGSGKSTLAKRLTPYNHYEADHYFTDAFGVYNFDASKLPDAHKQCQENVEFDMSYSCEEISVSNTFTRRWEMQVYYDLAAKFNYTVIEIVVKGSFQSVHSIPEAMIEKMRLRWEN